jgi:AcrR family transcriptional regulator
VSPEDRPQRLGLRERKKANTRAAIQRHALRLFREQGYDATTVEQIAEAAEVSQTTFFRYFPTKEDVLANDYNPLIIAAFRAQPAELTPIQALRSAMHAVISGMTAAERADFRERQMLVLADPRLQAVALVDLGQTIQAMAEVIAGRADRDPDDLSVRAMAGALMGVMISAVLYWAKHPEADMAAWIDQALASLEAGLRL